MGSLQELRRLGILDIPNTRTSNNPAQQTLKKLIYLARLPPPHPNTRCCTEELCGQCAGAAGLACLCASAGQL